MVHSHPAVPLFVAAVTIYLFLIPPISCAFSSPPGAVTTATKIALKKHCGTTHRSRADRVVLSPPPRKRSFVPINTRSAFILTAVPPDDLNVQVESDPPPKNEKEGDEESPSAAALLGGDGGGGPPPTLGAAQTTAFMIPKETKRALIEDLGYRRVDIDAMRVELAGPIVSRSVRCPEGGMPESWKREDDEEEESGGSQKRMLSKLEEESKFPLKFPLMAVSTVLAGKGLTDAIVVVLKVNAGIIGASLTEEFFGFPVLGIDALCIILGVGLGLWTWKTMQ